MTDQEFQRRIKDTIKRSGIPTGPGPKRDVAHMTAMISLVSAAWLKNPEYRFGQLLGNALKGRDPFYIEDDELAEMIVDAANPRRGEAAK